MDLRLKQAGGHASSSASASASAPVPVPAPGQRNETPRQSGKRPMRSLTAEEKVSAIDRVHNGESKAAVARDMGVPESTLRGWCKSEEKLRSQARNSGNFERSSPIGSESDRSSASQTPPSDNPLSASGSTKRELSREDTSGLTVKRARYDNNATSTVGDVGLVAAGGPASSRATYFNGNFRNSLSATYPTMFPLNIADLTNSSAVNQQLQNQDLLKHMTILRSMIPFNLNNENGMQNFSQVASRLMAASITNNIMINGVNNNSTTKNKRKNNNSTQSHTSKTAYKHRLSPDIEKPSTSGSRGTSPVASTSTTNGPSNEQTPVRPTKEPKGIHDIVRNLMVHSQQQQLQQSGSYSNDIFNVYNMIPANYERTMLDTIIGNNNNIYNTNENGFITDLPESQQTNLEEAIRCAEKLLNFMNKHGQPIFTFTQVDMVRNIYIKLREHKDKNELKKNEVYTS